MKVKLWGTRGSLPSPGWDTLRYGGNTACVSVEGAQGTLLVLDGGSGIRNLGLSLPPDLNLVHILLTHLHMDHIQGLPFFIPLRRAGVEVHVWGPASTTLGLKPRLMRYLSPPLFPVSVREILSDLHFHEIPFGCIEIGEFSITAQLVIHLNPTVGYRVDAQDGVFAFLPDHEPALGARGFPDDPTWLSGYDLAKQADLLVHDAQYTAEEYQSRVGFGHSSIEDAFRFAQLAQVKQLATFHHDPSHSDDMLDDMMAQTVSAIQPAFTVTPGKEGAVLELGST